MSAVIKNTFVCGLAALAFGAAAAISSPPAFAREGAVVGDGGRGPPGGGGHGPPGVCREGPCNPPQGSTIGGGNKGSKCKPNGEGCQKQF